MRVMIYKGEKGALSALVEPSPGKGMIPVMVPAVTHEDVIGKVLPVITALRGPKPATPR